MVGLDADSLMFKMYKSGVITDEMSCGKTINHEVVLVGFNTATTTPYYILRNSWGTTWGLSGYAYIAISSSSSGVCGI